MLMDKMMMNQKKMLVHLLSYKPIVCLVALWRMGSSITISGDHPRKRFNPSLEPDIWRNIQDGKWGELTLAYTSYLSTTVLTGVPKSLASGHWLWRMLPTKASSWKGIMWQTGKKKTQAVEIYEEPWQKLVCQDTEEGQHDSNPGRIVKQAAHIHKASTGVFTRSSHPIW